MMVRTPVNFNRQLKFMAEEVNNIVEYWYLPVKLVPKLFIPDLLP